MRISTSQIFDAGALGIGRNQADLFKLQNQLSTGRKVLTPADDPIASAQALVLTQSKAVSEQFTKNQNDAKDKLSLAETHVASVGDLLQSVRDKLVQAGNTTLTNSDRAYITQELEARYSELMGIANAQDGNGDYLFSGYQGAVKPFSAAATGGVVYQGDAGKRLLQVDVSRQMASNVSGQELFESIRNGNGSFTTAAATTAGAPVNTGSGIIDQGSVTSPSDWLAAQGKYPGGATILFSVTGGVTNYQLQLLDGSGAVSYTGPTQPYIPGQAITLNDAPTVPLTSMGANVVITGQPAAGDAFTIRPSTNQSVFTTLRNAINTLTSGIGGAYTSTEFSNRLADGLTDIDQALENVNKVRSTIGANLNELSSLGDSGSDIQLQYATSLSGLQDLDYAKAITEMSQKQMQLQAAQLSFKQTSQLSLFSIL